MVAVPESIGGKIRIIRQHIDKVLIAASGLTILIGGYFTVDYRNYVDCQVALMEESRQVTNVFADALDTLMAQPPRPVEERRKAFEDLQNALQHQRDVQLELGNCQ